MPTFFLMNSVDLKKIEELLAPMAQAQGCELVACEWTSEAGRRSLRVLLDKQGGVVLKDCEEFSRLVDPLLDVEGLISDRYDLEVSSPGLNRPLRKKADFERFCGELIFVRTRSPHEGRSNFKGLLKAVEGEKLLIEIDQQIFKIPLEEISKAKLEVDINKLLKNNKK